MTTIELLQDRLKDTHIVWAGSKATDAKQLQRFGKSLSIVSLIGAGKDIAGNIDGFSLEDEIGERIDYDRFSWDKLEKKHATTIVNHIKKLKNERSVIIVPFSSSQFFSNIGLSIDNVTVATNFFHLEQAFNYKPWVEYQFRKKGIPVLTWSNHIAGYEENIDVSFNSWLTRPASSSGGLGMVRSFSLSQVQKTVNSKLSSDISSTAEFFEDAFSLNITACVFPSGKITIHPISSQIIGAEVSTNRMFGYCGNDFGVVRSILTDSEVQLIEDITVNVGQWLHGYKYIGAFGLDIMKVDNKILISELNARFQASSHLGAELMINAGFSDIYTDHLAAYLGAEPQEHRPNLLKIINSYTPLAQIFCYNTPLNQHLGVRSMKDNSLYRVELLPRHTRIQHHALLFRIIAKETVMDNGKILNSEIIEMAASQKSSLIPHLETIE